MDQPDIKPPVWPLKFLRFFVKKEYIEEIEGDMEEIFYEHVESVSLPRARRMYAWEVIKLIRPVLVKNLEALHNLNQIPMFKNYFKTSLRSLLRHPLNSFINVFGLSAAIGVCVFVYGFVQWGYRTDQFHEHKHEVHLVTFFADRDGTLQEHGRTPRPLGDMLRNDFAHIQKVCRVEDRNVIVKHEDNVFHERIRYTDPEFLEMFTFPLKWGAVGSLKDVNSIILSENEAIKYFGEQNPVGSDILVKFNETESKAFKITGVAEAFPQSHTIEFDFLVNFENLRTSGKDYRFDDWSSFVDATFIQADARELSTIKKGMDKYRSMQNAAVTEDWAIASFSFEPLATLHENSSHIRDDISWSTDDNFSSSVFLGFIAVFMLALACFNYINIAIASAAKRLKEIGVRKTIGATQRVIIVQFLTENVVVTFFALTIGLALGAYLFIPYFENMWHFDMGFSWIHSDLWIYLAVILFVTAIASGSYPAFYISSFRVTGILKGSVKFGRENLMTKFFLGFQLVLACIFITSAVTFTMNTSYLTHRSWGYGNRAVLYVAVPDQAAFEKLSVRVAENPDVLAISGSAHHIGKSFATTIMHLPGRELEADQLSVDATYFETLDIPLKEGRVFSDQSENDKRTVVVNEVLVNNLALKNPLGYVFKIDSVDHEIIGVVKDFHSYNFFKKITPTIFKVARKEDYRYLAVKVQSGTEAAVYKKVQASWSDLYPETPFDGGYQEDVWGSYYEEIGHHASVWKFFASMAVLLACLGLYGLIRFNVAGRVKEFSIRKILGAGTAHIADNITRRYLILLAAALSIGAPVSYALMKFIFDMAFYDYHVPITFSIVIVSVSILVFVVFLTFSTQIRKVLRSNPVEGLKVE